ncbi:hypothetical protein AO724_20340 [Aeromonas allosaccharophila]|uniref:Uncharacterized protein n=1 Tax=Aeromonas allosaccharophila TaxID=656 RepID=A0A0T6U7K5_9GAMM|nr:MULTISPECIES: hypothetical protein [Aeromonas]KRW54011.1 hypothetical protein AO724_20340 [Aeromonas allosaccharophila]QPR53681.1 hypothetical protein I6G90_14615 [Aeromonas allosaccharophila]
MNMKNVIKMLAVAGLMTTGFANASVPADFNAMPGVLFVNWNATAAMDGKANPMLEVRDEAGDLITSAHADLTGTQQIRLPLRTQGTVTVSLAGQSSEYRIPFGIGGGNPR